MVQYLKLRKFDRKVNMYDDVVTRVVARVVANGRLTYLEVCTIPYRRYFIYEESFPLRFIHRHSPHGFAPIAGQKQLKPLWLLCHYSILPEHTCNFDLPTTGYRIPIMALPSFVSTRRPRTKYSEKEISPPSSNFPGESSGPSPHTVRAATRTRLIFSLFTSFLFLVALVFLILVEIGNTRRNRPILGSIYFMKLDLSHIIPRAVPQAQLINSIARTLGLHDFYQMGLWNFCEGYGDEISDCSRPRTLYWFNPVEIILDELLAGATSKDETQPWIECLVINKVQSPCLRT